jgi:hypothetical protein
MDVDKMRAVLRDVPKHVLEKAYSVDVVRRYVQLRYSQEVFEHMAFQKDGDYLTAVFNGVVITMKKG